MIHVQLSRSCERETEEGEGSGQRAPMIPSFSRLSRHLEAPERQEERERREGGGRWYEWKEGRKEGK